MSPKTGRILFLSQNVLKEKHAILIFHLALITISLQHQIKFGFNKSFPPFSNFTVTNIYQAVDLVASVGLRACIHPIT